MADLQLRNVKRMMTRLEQLAALEEMQRRYEQDHTVPVSEIASEAVKWVFNPWIPAGKLSVIFGEPGAGKSNFTLDIAARLSSGRPMPHSEPPGLTPEAPAIPDTQYQIPAPNAHNTQYPIPAPKALNTQYPIPSSSLPVSPSPPPPVPHRDPATVLLLSAEDSAADTIKPRLEAAGADCGRVRIIQVEGHTVIADPVWLETMIERHNAALVVVDPLSAYVGRRDIYRDQHMRQLLMPLAIVAEKTEAALLIVHHANKSGRGGALMRSAGSIGISAAARSVMMIARDPGSPTHRILAHVKGNLACPPTPIRFHFAQAESGHHARIAWDGPVENVTADGLMHCGPRLLSAHASAVQFLREALAQGPMLSSELEALATAQGISRRTFDRAKQAIAVSARVGGVAGAGEWQTSLRAISNR